MRCSAVMALVIIVAIVHGMCECASIVTDIFHSSDALTFMLQSVQALRRRAASASAKTGHWNSSKRTSR